MSLYLNNFLAAFLLLTVMSCRDSKKEVTQQKLLKKEIIQQEPIEKEVCERCGIDCGAQEFEKDAEQDLNSNE